MEWLQSVEDLLNDLAFMAQYGKVFAIAICIAFLIVFAGMIIINANIRDIKKQNEYLLEVIESRTLRKG